MEYGDLSEKSTIVLDRLIDELIIKHGLDTTRTYRRITYRDEVCSLLSKNSDVWEFGGWKVLVNSNPLIITSSKKIGLVIEGSIVDSLQKGLLKIIELDSVDHKVHLIDFDNKSSEYIGIQNSFRNDILEKLLKIA